MPHPQVAPGVIDGHPVAEGELVGACAGEYYDGSEGPVLARTMPWILSVLLHLGVGVIMAFLAMLAIPAKAKVPASYVPQHFDTKGDPETSPIGFAGTGNLSPASARLAPQAAPDQNWQKLAETQVPTINSLSAGPVNLRRPIGPVGGKIGSLPPGRRKDPPFVPLPPGRGRADHVVFVIDRSGSMVTTFDMVRLAMYQRIIDMEPAQQFHVILYASGDVEENPPRRLVRVTDDEKDALVVFLKEVQPRNQTDPVPALKRAFAVMRSGRQAEARSDHRPPRQLIYLLSDGEFPKNDQVLAAIRKFNPAGAGQVHMNTILYGTRPPEAEKVMKLIAKENKGCYKYTSPDE